jgi:hypothetical protein
VLNGQTYTFDIFGLRQDVFLMVDRETGSIWTHLEGKAIEGPMTGEQLAMLPMPLMTWEEWQKSSPDTLVLSPDTEFADNYRPVQIARYNQREDQFGDDRLASNALVVGVEENGNYLGYPVEVVKEAGGVINDLFSGEPLLVIFNSESVTGLAFSRNVDGQVLEFYNGADQGLELRDRNTGSLWDIHGQAVDGPLAGSTLNFVPSFISEWYGWSAYHPETGIYTPGS